MARLYFAYGSNLHLEQMQHRCPDAIPLRRWSLDGWKLVFRGVADIVQAPRARKALPGALYLISKTDELALDRYEGFPRLYGKVEIDDPTYGEIMFYTMNRRGMAPPYESYLATIREGYRAWGLPQAYLDAAARPRRGRLCA